MCMKLRFLCYILATVLCGINVFGQTSAGGWKIHAIFSDDIQNIIDTGSKVYYLSSGNLFSYDKQYTESEHYSKLTKLTSVNISGIYYNYDQKYLAIAYEDYNIDILYDNGKVVNVPDIADADINDKTINDITFRGNKVYVATDFGYAILNGDKSFEVSESHNYGEKILSAAEALGYLWLSTSSDLFYSPASQNHHSLSAFSPMNSGGGGHIYLMDNEKFIFSNWGVNLVKLNADGTPSISWYSEMGINQIKIMHPTVTGYLAVDTASPRRYAIFDNDGNCTLNEMPEGMEKSLLSSYESDGSFWELSGEGVRHVSIKDNTLTVLSFYYICNSSSVSYPYNLKYNDSQKKLYVWNCGPNRYQTSYNIAAQANTLDQNEVWTNITPESVPTTGEYAENILKDPFYPVFDPDDPSTYFVGTWFEGVYKITDKKAVAKYDWTNSPLKQDWTCFASNLFFDGNKNLWLTQGVNSPKIYVLPRAKQSQSNLTAADWLTVNIDIPTGTGQFMQAINTSRDIKIMAVDNLGKTLLVINDGGSPASSSIKYKMYSSGQLYDQDEKAFTWDQITCFVEDANGRVWVGTNNGVIEFNPSNALNDNFRINHIKVPRNDGTNLADYLLSGTEVTALATDGANRKWIGTASMGLYLVSSDGSEILKHFTTDNSQLTSDRIVSVCCNPNSNSVYVGTPTGLVEYLSDAAPASDDYSNIYAYPNPVTPDYTGEIIITGLMENSLVKIADSAGNVIRNLQSTGGMVSWDGCYSNGERVKTGVYYVLASQNEDSHSSGVVTKILFIK